MIADSGIDDFAAALVGRLKAEARESKAAREDFFLPSICMTIWKLLYDRELYWETFLGGAFNVCILIWEWDTETVWEKPRLQRKKEKPDSMLSVCNFCMQLLFFSSLVLASFAGSSWNWIHQYWMTFMSLQCGNRQLELWTCFCCQRTSDVNLTVTCDVCCSAGNFVVFRTKPQLLSMFGYGLWWLYPCPNQQIQQAQNLNKKKKNRV